MGKAARSYLHSRRVPRHEWSTVVAEADRVWDATGWNTGRRDDPTCAELEAACTAVRRDAHGLVNDQPPQPCPAVRNRLRLLRSRGCPPPPSNVIHRTHAAARFFSSGMHDADSTDGAHCDSEPGTLGTGAGACATLSSADLAANTSFSTKPLSSGLWIMERWPKTTPRLIGTVLAGITWRNDRQFSAGLNVPCGWSEAPHSRDLFGVAHSGALGSAIIWIERLWGERRTYPDTAAVENRLAFLLSRLQHFAQTETIRAWRKSVGILGLLQGKSQ